MSLHIHHCQCHMRGISNCMVAQDQCGPASFNAMPSKGKAPLPLRARKQGCADNTHDENCQPEVVAVADDRGVNAEYLAEFAGALETVKTNRHFKGISEAYPVGIDSALGTRSGVQNAFTLENYRVAMTAAKSYECGCNLFWLSLHFTTLQGIPYNKGVISKACDHMFAAPTRCPTLSVAITDISFNPLEHKGALRPVSPEELFHAWIWAVHRDIQKGEGTNMLGVWKHMALTTPMKFVLLSSDEDIRCV